MLVQRIERQPDRNGADTLLWTVRLLADHTAVVRELYFLAPRVCQCGKDRRPKLPYASGPRHWSERVGGRRREQRWRIRSFFTDRGQLAALGIEEAAVDHVALNAGHASQLP